MMIIQKQGKKEFIKMHKKGEVNELVSIIAYFVMYSHISSYKNGAAVWEDFYAKEISKILNSAKPGDQLSLDVDMAGNIARENKVFNDKEMFNFDNEKNEVCVKLNTGKKSCYSYFNNVEVIGWRVDPGMPADILRINIGKEAVNNAVQ